MRTAGGRERLGGVPAVTGRVADCLQEWPGRAMHRSAIPWPTAWPRGGPSATPSERPEGLSATQPYRNGSDTAEGIDREADRYSRRRRLRPGDTRRSQRPAPLDLSCAHATNGGRI
jgi:hypothetical protein